MENFLEDVTPSLVFLGADGREEVIQKRDVVSGGAGE